MFYMKLNANRKEEILSLESKDLLLEIVWQE